MPPGHKTNKYARMAMVERRADGRPIASSGSVAGPGLWVTCIRGKEKFALSEMYEVLVELVDELYPSAQTEYAAFKAVYHGGNLAAATGGLPVEAGGAFEKKDDLEDELARELAELNAPLTAPKDKGIRNVNLIGTHPTEIECMLWFSLKPPIDPLALTQHYARRILAVGISNTRYCQRLLPATHSCTATLPEVLTLVTTRLYPPVFGVQSNLKFRVLHNAIHNQTLERGALIRALAEAVPKEKGHSVHLGDEADVIISVRILRNVASFCLLPGKDFAATFKLNIPSMVAAAKGGTAKDQDSRVAAMSATKQVPAEGAGSGEVETSTSVV